MRNLKHTKALFLIMRKHGLYNKIFPTEKGITNETGFFQGRKPIDPSII